MRPFLSIFFAISMSLAFVGPLHAAAQCGNYGKEAAAQAQRSDELKCGFGGKDDPRFWNDPNAHARWCVGAKPESVNAEKAGRGHSLSKCAMCRAYSDQANAAAQDNRKFRCGFDGARWSSGDGGPNDGHFSWCMNQREHDAAGFTTFQYGLTEVKQSRLDPETNARTADLKACKAKIPEHFSEAERKFCRDYAKTAFADANINVAKKCGATPVSRWSQSEREHFEACIPIAGTEAGKAFLTKEEEIRRRGADACVTGKYTISADGSELYRKMGRPPKSKVAADPDKMKQQMTPRPSGGSDKSSDKSKGSATNAPAGTSSGGSGAMERLGGGPSGGYDNVRDVGTPGGKSKPTPAGAAIIAPAATATQPAASSSSGGGTKCFGRSCGGGSAVDSGFYNPAPARPVR